MKNTIIISITLLTFFSLLALAYTINKADSSKNADSTVHELNSAKNDTRNKVNQEHAFSDTDKKLTQNEIDGLVQMREEEKLAHDVYITLYEKYNQKIFLNISKSELQHTNSVKSLLAAYEIEDPVADTTVGAFTDKNMQNLYDELVAQGSSSLENAFKVGATIEDLDIYDLNVLLSETENTDIIMVYENLKKGSENHMRAFTKQLDRTNTSYSAQYITQEELDLIIEF